ncbi:MAG: SOS response-associated peptidase [Verrucomicrobia bacterium]|nr:SOS response-associated peptidase [Verrucomicrobiota bacterium]
MLRVARRPTSVRRTGKPMCGRVTQFSRWEEIARSLGAPSVSVAPRFNISPGTPLLSLRREQGRLLTEPLFWGFTPAWAAPEAGEAGHANARVEGIFDKPTFREAARLRRCLVPVDGYYEWKTEGRFKLPYYFRAADGGPLAFAGLWSLQVVPGGPPRRSLCLLTVSPNREAAEVHSRMPVLLPPEKRSEWLSERALEPAAFAAFAQTAPDRSLSLQRVSADVNRVGIDAPHLVEPLRGSMDQPDFLGDLLG